MASDPLSGLHDAGAFLELLAREELRRSRTGEPLTVAVIDLDGLRSINARHGATAGTGALRACAAALRSTARGVDDLARTGHDEFSVLLHATGAGSAGAWVDRFEDALELVAGAHPAAPVTCAIGLADSTEASTLLSVAGLAGERMRAIQGVRKLRRARDERS